MRGPDEKGLHGCLDPITGAWPLSVELGALCRHVARLGEGAVREGAQVLGR